jgi:multiple sugar transport system substrate-binding protein
MMRPDSTPPIPTPLPVKGRPATCDAAGMADVIDFLEALAAETGAAFELSNPDPYIRMAAHLIRQHLEARPVTATSLAAASGLPYATAKRRIADMLNAGLIEQRPRTATGKSFSLHPSDMLIHDFTAYLDRVRRLGERAFGGPATPETERDYYFGGSYTNTRSSSRRRCCPNRCAARRAAIPGPWRSDLHGR